MKIAPLVRELKRENIPFAVVHTCQHYDYEMSRTFFEDLELPEPDHYLDAGSGSHAEQTARIMVRFEKICTRHNPSLIVVVGDVNSTLACSITGKKAQIPVAHVEAGLRSYDLTMPEEINRIVTDSLTDYFFVTETAAIENLKKEGKPDNKIFFVGHVMIDNLFYQLERLNTISFETAKLKKQLGQYLFLTLHRPSNVDDYKTLKKILDGLNEIAESIAFVFPIHPRTKERLEEFNLKMSDNIKTLKPLSFSESLYLWKDAAAVLTDSGGLQEETTALGVPCLTLRNNTERPITIEIGTNTLVSTDTEKMKKLLSDILNNQYKKGQIPEKWDGHAAKRIVQIIKNAF